MVRKKKEREKELTKKQQHFVGKKPLTTIIEFIARVSALQPFHICMYRHIQKNIHRKDDTSSQEPWFIWFLTAIYFLLFPSLCALHSRKFLYSTWICDRKTKQPTTKQNQSQITQRIFVFICLPVSLGYIITAVISSKCRHNQIAQ